ncbi:MAG TPA: NAD-dependent epimerase/dehydratase family protein [Bacteroidales bacterium]|nr:NAD-dependent epimerase/dehydratase family protein [Bacteroidales bacterium]
MEPIHDPAGMLNNDLAYVMRHSPGLIPALNDRTLLITGGTGFFGKWMLESLLFAIRERGLRLKIYLLSRDPERFKTQFPHLCPAPYVNFLKGDVTCYDFPEIKVDFIIHAATEASAKLTAEEPLVMIDNIIEGTRNVLEFARKQQVKRMLFMSSGAVYGVQPAGLKGFPETFSGSPDTLSPASAYAEAKRAAELLCACYNKLYGIEIPVARCFAFVGPYLNLDIHYAIGNFIRNGLNGETITIKGDGKPLRSYMYAADLVIWLFRILLFGKPSEAYNVGSDQAISIKDLAFKVASFFPGLNVEVLNQTRPTDRNQDYVPDITKFKNEFNNHNFLNLDESLSKTITYHKNSL